MTLKFLQRVTPKPCLSTPRESFLAAAKKQASQLLRLQPWLASEGSCCSGTRPQAWLASEDSHWSVCWGNSEWF